VAHARRSRTFFCSRLKKDSMAALSPAARDCPNNGVSLRVGGEGSLMTETLAGVSPLNTEELLEEPSLAEAAVAGAAGGQ